MSDWPSIVISAASGLAGAGIGGYAAWKAAVKAGTDARDLAAAERAADEAERKSELARSAARTTRTIVADALARMFNVPAAVARQVAGTMDADSADRVANMALAALNTVADVLRQDAYLLPTEVRARLENFYRLMGFATVATLTDQQVGPDVNAYGRYLDLSLQAVVRGEEVPVHVEPPDLTDSDRPLWVPNPLPAGWQ